MDMARSDIWIIIVGLGLGTYLIRLSFIGLVGDRPMPSWLLRLLRFTPVAVLPAVVAPMLLGAQAGPLEPAKLIAALATLAMGFATRNVLYAILTGMGLFFGLGALGF